MQGLTIVLVSNTIFAAMFLPYILSVDFIWPSLVLGIGQLVWIPVSLLVYVVLRQGQLLAGMFLATVISFAIFFLLFSIGLSQIRLCF